MATTSIKIAEAYYNAMSNKDLDSMGKYLHPNVHFQGPLAELKGKESVLQAASGFFPFFNNLIIHEKFGDGDKAMLVYDFNCQPPIGKFRAATLFIIKDELISSIELFFDARPFEMNK